MIKLHRALMAGALLALASVSAQADSIKGSLVITASEVSTGGVDLNSATTINVTDPYASGKPAPGGTGSTGDLTQPQFTGYDSFTVNLADALTGFGVVLNNADYGKFVATGGSIISNANGALALYLIGDLTPGTLNSSATGGQASLRLSFNQTGGAIGMTGTLNAPPVPLVPEPASIAMAGISLAAAGLVRVLRKRSV